MSATFDPYYKWLAIPPAEQPPNHYRLLALALFESDPDVIATAADQRMSHVRSFQGGQFVDASQKLLNELAAARICLLRPDKKSAYDAALRAKLQPAAAPSPAPKLAPLPRLEPGSPAAASPPSSEKLPPVGRAPQNLPAIGNKPASSRPTSQESLDLVDDTPPAVVEKKNTPGSGEFKAKVPVAKLVSPPAKNAPAANRPATVSDEMTPAQIAAAKALARQGAAGQFSSHQYTANQYTAEQFAADVAAGSQAKRVGTWQDSTDPLGIDELGGDSSQSPLLRKRKPALPRVVLLAPLLSICVVIGAVIYSSMRDEEASSADVGAAPAKSVARASPPQPHAAPLTPPPVDQGQSFGSNSSNFGGDAPPLFAGSSPSGTESPAPKSTPEKANDQSKPAETTKPRAPDPSDQRASLVEIKKDYKDDFAKATSVEGRSALAKKLFDAAKTNDDATKRYVLATQSLDIAIKLCDVQLASDLVSGLTYYYEVDPWDLKARTLAQLAETAKTSALVNTPKLRREIADLAYALVDKANGEQRYDTAEHFAATAADLAVTLRDTAFQETTREAHARARRLAHDFDAMQAAQERLASNPNDAAAHLAIGRFLCMDRDDWDAGLQHLEHGSDPELSAIARRELSGAPDAADQVAIGDAWWNLAEHRRSTPDSPLVKPMKARAVFWYRQVRDSSQLGEAASTKIDHRIAEVDASAASKSKETPEKTSPSL